MAARESVVGRREESLISRLPTLVLPHFHTDSNLYFKVDLNFLIDIILIY